MSAEARESSPGSGSPGPDPAANSAAPTITAAPATDGPNLAAATAVVLGDPTLSGDEEGNVARKSWENMRPDTAMDGFSIGLSIDTHGSDADSTLGDPDIASTSISVTSSTYEFVEEFGRTFHKYKEGKYFMPNDEQEQSRLDLQHEIAKRLLGGRLCLAPIDHRMQRVLDLGTGTGIWVVEFAENHPGADILGTDLSPIQPVYVPPNCRFEIDDADDEWVWSYKFDYIHGRYVIPFLTDKPKLMKNIYDNLNPGGYVEFMESPILFQSVDSSLEGTALKKWNDLLLEGLTRIGRDPMAALHLNLWMSEAGFINITEKRIAVPINPWAKGDEQKTIGALQMVNMLDVIHGITMSVFTKALGWAVEEAEVLLAQVRKDLQDRKIHSFLAVVAIWAQKPE